MDKGPRNPEDNIIKVMTSKEVTKLYKTFLEVLEDLQKEHDTMMERIEKKAGKEFADLVNYLTHQKHEQIRKRILDHGNECERNILFFLSFFDSTINIQKINEAARQKIVTKKTFISPPVII